VKKDEFIPKHLEPEKNTAWDWIKWSEFSQKENLFIPFKYFFEQGYRDLEKIEAQANRSFID
jgi:hypothetical protein